MATRRTKNTQVDGVSPALVPRDDDAKYCGPEPMLSDIDELRRQGILAKSLGWYNRFYSKKEAKEFIAVYLESLTRVDEAKIIRKANDSDITNTYGWLARLVARGLVLNQSESLKLNDEIKRIINVVSAPVAKSSSTKAIIEKPSQEQVAAAKANIQEVMKEKAREANGELEGMLDEFIISGAKTSHTLKPIDEVAKKNVLPQHIPLLVDHWKKKKVEFSEAYDGKDKILNEAYSQYTKIELRNTLKFIDFIVDELNSYITVKKVARTPRAKKAVPVEKIVSGIKYLKEYVDAPNKLKMESVSPTLLHGCVEAWVYDTAKRRLHHYLADSHSKTISVKGTSLIGFDTVTSESKTIRKPATLNEFIKAGKPAQRKFFKEVNSVATVPSGRINDSCILIRAF